MSPEVTQRINDRVDRVVARLDRLAVAKKAQQEREDQQAAEREIAYREQKTQYQASVDSLYHAWNQAPPVPVSDESPRRYRRRVLKDMQRHLPPGSPFSSMRLTSLPKNDDAALNIIGDKIKDAFQAALTDPATVAPGDFREIRLDDPRSGQRISSFVGRESFVKLMGSPCRQVVGGSDGLRKNSELLIRQR
jgi:hypothetical protein